MDGKQEMESIDKAISLLIADIRAGSSDPKIFSKLQRLIWLVDDKRKAVNQFYGLDS